MPWVNGYTLEGLKNKIECAESNINYLSQRIHELEKQLIRGSEFTGRLLKVLLKLKEVRISEHNELQKLTKKEAK